MLDKFVAHCHSIGISVNKDDTKFIIKRLRFVSVERRRKILSKYIDEWKSGSKLNNGRFRANSWLLNLDLSKFK